MSDIALECVQKELEQSYDCAIREIDQAVSALRELKRVLKQAQSGNLVKGPPICYKQHTDMFDLHRHRICMLEQLVEEIEFERRMEHDTSGVTTPLKLWKKDQS